MRLAGIASSVVLVACGSSGTANDSPVAPAPAVRPVTIVQQKSATDTIDASLSQPIIVEARDTKTGLVRAGVEVRFEAIDDSTTNPETAVARVGSANYSRVAVDTSDAAGRARAAVRLGRVAGSRRITTTTTTPAGSDTATFVTTAGATVSVEPVPKDTAIVLGRSLRQGLMLFDRGHNATPAPVQVSVTTPSVCGADADGTVHSTDYGLCGLSLASGQIQRLVGLAIVPDATILVRRGTTIGSLSLDMTGFAGIADVDTLTYPNLARWLASGTEIAFIERETDSTSHVAIIGASGSKRTFATLPFPMGRNRISADGNWVTSVTGSSSAPFSASIVRVRQDGTGLRYACQASCDYYGAFTSISPDGSEVLYGDDRISALADFAAGTGFGMSALLAAEFSMDGSRFATILPNHAVGIRAIDQTTTNYIVNPNGNSFSMFYGWSPDGKWLLVYQFSASVYLISTTDGKIIPLPPNIGTNYIVIGGFKP